MAVESVYGKRRGLQDFAGMVTYWQDYRTLFEGTFSRFALAKLAIENSARAWPLYEQAALDFLELTPLEESCTLDGAALKSFVGTYTYLEDEEMRNCLVSLEDALLVVDNMPQVWPRTKLLQRTENVFLVESLPFQVTFEKGTDGKIIGIRASGPELFDGKMDRFFSRVSE